MAVPELQAGGSYGHCQTQGVTHTYRHKTSWCLRKTYCRASAVVTRANVPNGACRLLFQHKTQPGCTALLSCRGSGLWYGCLILTFSVEPLLLHLHVRRAKTDVAPPPPSPPRVSPASSLYWLDIATGKLRLTIGACPVAWPSHFSSFLHVHGAF